MREYIAKKINSMTDLDEKKALRTVMEQIFLPLYDETTAKYQALEERVRNEMPPVPNEYAVYSTMLPKNKAEYYAHWLHPITMIEENSLLVGSKNKLKKGIILDTVFLEEDYLICREIINNSQQFSGVIHTGDQDLSILACLKPSGKYKDKVVGLYSHFINNGVPWTTLNLPYIHKMFDIVLLRDVEIPASEGQEALNWEISFGKYAVKKDLVPVWNISRFEAVSDDFPIPIIDKKSYEYHFELVEMGVQNGYLADYDSAPLVGSRRESEVYIVIAPDKLELKWDMFQFSKPEFFDTLSFPYPVVSNKQEDHFAGRMVSYYGSKVNTRAELARIINSFDIGSYIKFESLRVLNNTTGHGESYESNFFLVDEIRDENISKTLMLHFSKNINKNIYLLRDIMSFVVSQVQLMYPEYNCVGALL